MKNPIKIFAFCFMMAAMSLGISSCESETCYECTGTEDNGIITLEDLGEICEGEDGTAEEVDQTVSVYEALGGTCIKK